MSQEQYARYNNKPESPPILETHLDPEITLAATCVVNVILTMSGSAEPRGHENHGIMGMEAPVHPANPSTCRPMFSRKNTALVNLFFFFSVYKKVI